MGNAEVKAEQLELASALDKVVLQHRAQWRSEHGQSSKYGPIAIGAITRALNTQLIGMFTEEHGRPPPFKHLADTCRDYPPVLIADAGELLGVRVKVVDVDQLIGEVAREILGEVRP